MKAIVCELCNGNDVVKQGDYFVCQSCGTKYEPEAAKKLMVEVNGKVDVSGSAVVIDRSSELESLYKMARQAKDAENRDIAIKYYEQILTIDPSNWEASFFIVYFTVQGCNIRDIYPSAVQLKNSISTTVKQIKERETMREDQIAAGG